MHDHVGTWAKANTKASDNPRPPLEPKKSALLIIDMQNYSCHADCGWTPVFKEHFPEVYAYRDRRMNEVVIPNVRKLIDSARRSQARVIYFRLGSALPDWSDVMPFHRDSALRTLERYGRRIIANVGTFEHEVYAEIAPAAGDLVLDKTTKSAFTSTGIDQLLRNLGVEHLVFCGVATDACVETTARDAADRGYHCTIVDDGCSARDQESHDASLRAFDKLFGRVLPATAVLEEYGR